MSAKLALLTIASALFVSGMGYSTFLFLKPKNLREELILNKYTLIEKNDTESWKKLAEIHKNKKNEPIKLFNLSIDRIKGLTDIIQGDKDGIKKLQEKCEELLDEELDDPKIDSWREEIKNWCVKESVLLKAGEHLLKG